VWRLHQKYQRSYQRLLFILFKLSSPLRPISYPTFIFSPMTRREKTYFCAI
jgi:hypothetical protein